MPTTLPTPTAWTPEGIAALIGALTALVVAISALLKVILERARSEARSDANAKRLDDLHTQVQGVQSQVIEVAKATPVPGTSTLVIPSSLAQAQVRDPGDPGGRPA